MSARGLIRQAPVGELEERIVPQAVGIVAVLVAGGDHQQAETQDLGEAVLDAFWRARIVDAGGETPRHAEARLDLTQRQQAAIGRERSTVEAGDDRLAGDRCQARQGQRSVCVGGHGVRKRQGSGFAAESYCRSTACTMLATPDEFSGLVVGAFMSGLESGTQTSEPGHAPGPPLRP